MTAALVCLAVLGPFAGVREMGGVRQLGTVALLRDVRQLRTVALLGVEETVAVFLRSKGDVKVGFKTNAKTLKPEPGMKLTGDMRIILAKGASAYIFDGAKVKQLSTTWDAPSKPFSLIKQGAKLLAGLTHLFERRKTYGSVGTRGDEPRLDGVEILSVEPIGPRVASVVFAVERDRLGDRKLVSIDGTVREFQQPRRYYSYKYVDVFITEISSDKDKGAAAMDLGQRRGSSFQVGDPAAPSALISSISTDGPLEPDAGWYLSHSDFFSSLGLWGLALQDAYLAMHVAKTREEKDQVSLVLYDIMLNTNPSFASYHAPP